MYKSQKTFSPLDCSLCHCMNCKYKAHYEQLYSLGFKIPVADCKRLQEQERKLKLTKGRLRLL